MATIGIVPRVEGTGGMASFRLKFEVGLAARGFEVTHNPDEADTALLVIAGTKNLLPLWRAKRRGVRIVQRLDGINWIHRKRNTGWRHYVRAEYGNFILSFIRRFLADHILYQSAFSKKWWEDWYGKTRVLSTVVHNGVDLNIYSVGHTPALAPGASVANLSESQFGNFSKSQFDSDIINNSSLRAPFAKQSPRSAGRLLRRDERPPRNDGRTFDLLKSPYRLLVVEGSLGGGYDMGLDNALRLAETLNDKHDLPMQLVVVGRISDDHRARVESKAKVPIEWLGVVPRERIPEIDRSAHLLFSADLNPACPNAVIEALACGLPVAAFDTGALNELVIGDAGRLVPYGGNVWNIDPPDIESLASASAEILRDQPRFRKAARAHAESALGLDQMVDGYLKVLLE